MLKDAFEFTDADLDANRASRLTDWQRSLLHQKQSKLLPMAIFAVVALIIIILAFSHPGIRLVVLACLGGLLVLFFSKWQGFSRDLQQTGVSSIKGWASKRKTGRGGVYHKLDVGGETFIVTPFQYEQMLEGAEYRISYAPHSRTILSVEKIPERVKP